ncbi:MAG: diphthine--ammonia ligase [Planctomycetes bacterium]|jgi:uncharacterized protein (TIGR00290 family)|nr:diphthine--ammonia ligase [Planctomycetota bacterium]
MVSWSGGKDSCLAMHRAARAGARIEVLVNMKVEGGERSRSHGLRSGVIDAQAKAMGVRLDGMATSWDNYEANVVSILGRLVSEGIEAGIFGDIDLHAHLEWEEMVCGKAGLIPVLPIWQGGRMELVREFIEAGFRTHIVALRAELLSPNYLGRPFTLDLAREFQAAGIDACGENGEFHTVVTDGPLFQYPIEILPGRRVLKEGYWFLDFDVREPQGVAKEPA